MSAEAGVCVVGLGNIGSQLVPLLARQPGLERLVLVDPDQYGEENLGHQNVDRAELGMRKVDAMAARVRRAAPGIAVKALAETVENVPPGRLRAAVLVGCVDSRRGRRELNRLAFRLGMPWLDAAVDGGAGVARMAGYAPDGGCLECRWGPRDYELLEPVHACSAGAAPTRAPVLLGAMAASWLALGVAELLAGNRAPCGTSVFIDCGSRTLQRASFHRNPACLFDHQCPALLGELSAACSLGELKRRHSGADRLRAEGQTFACASACDGCRRLVRAAPVLSRALARRRCTECGAGLVPLALGAVDSLRLDGHGASTPLAALGLEPGDLVSLGSADGPLASFEIGGS